MKESYREFLPLSLLLHAVAAFLWVLVVGTGWNSPNAIMDVFIVVGCFLLVIIFGFMSAISLEPLWFRRIILVFLFIGIPAGIGLNVLRIFAPPAVVLTVVWLIMIFTYILFLLRREWKRFSRLPAKPDYFKAGIFSGIIILSCCLLAGLFGGVMRYESEKIQNPNSHIETLPTPRVNINDLKLKAEKGDAKAQFQMGTIYEEGAEGVILNRGEAVKWYRRAAKHGFAEAQRRLGTAYDYGKGVRRDRGESVKWYQKAAKQGNPAARIALQAMTAIGHGAADKKEGFPRIDWMNFKNVFEVEDSLESYIPRGSSPEDVQVFARSQNFLVSGMVSAGEGKSFIIYAKTLRDKDLLGDSKWTMWFIFEKNKKLREIGVRIDVAML